MALLGFDGLTDGNLMSKSEWDVVTAWSTVVTGRSSDTDGAVGCTGNTSKVYTLPSAAATVIYGIAFNFTLLGAIGASNVGASQFGGMTVGGVVQCMVGTNTSGFIEVRRGTVWSTGTILATSSGHTPIGIGAWHQVEVQGLMHTSTGRVIVKLDGFQVIDTGSVQTAATSGSVNAMRFGSGTGSGVNNSLQYDDLYVCDAVDATATQGQANNAFLGDVRVQVLVPTGVGDTTQWTPSSAVANWTTVDEIPPNTTDYNSDAVSGHRDLYALADLSGAVGTIFGVQEGLYASKVEAGTAGIKPLLKENTVVTSDASQGVSTTFAPVWAAMRAVKPSNSAVWTPTDVNALQAGAEVA